MYSSSPSCSASRWPAAAGETAFCDTKVTKKGRITVKTKGYEAVRVSVIVRTKPKPGFTDRWKPDTWRKSWKLKWRSNSG